MSSDIDSWLETPMIALARISADASAPLPDPMKPFTTVTVSANASFCSVRTTSANDSCVAANWNSVNAS